MRYRVKVTGRSVRGAYGTDIYVVASPADVADRDGVLVITTVPYEGRPAMDRFPARKPTGPSVVAYPRGGWDRVVITKILEAS